MFLDKESGSCSSRRRHLEDNTLPTSPKRRAVSFARLEELQVENERLKKQIEKFKNEYMRKSVALFGEDAPRNKF